MKLSLLPVQKSLRRRSKVKKNRNYTCNHIIAYTLVRVMMPSQFYRLRSSEWEDNCVNNELGKTWKE